MGLINDISKLFRLSFPTGRAFAVSRDSVKQKLIEANAKMQAGLLGEADSILNHILPDNDQFTMEDALLWEERLGIFSDPNTSLADKKAAIIQKLNHPGNILARQSAGFIEYQLQLAGFNVWVYENLSQVSPVTYFYSQLVNIAEHGPNIEHMETGMEHGSQNLWIDTIANHINWELDQFFDPGVLSRTFFIGGQASGTFAEIPIERREEFRRLVLQLKPARTVVYCGINYI